MVRYKPIYAGLKTSTNGNWRFTFTFKAGQAYALDYEGYH